MAIVCTPTIIVNTVMHTIITDINSAVVSPNFFVAIFLVTVIVAKAIDSKITVAKIDTKIWAIFSQPPFCPAACCMAGITDKINSITTIMICF